MRALTEAEFNEWKSHPGTQAVMEILSSRREALRQAWEGGSFTDYEAGTTALINVGNIGTCLNASIMSLDLYVSDSSGWDRVQIQSHPCTRSDCQPR